MISTPEMFEVPDAAFLGPSPDWPLPPGITVGRAVPGLRVPEPLAPLRQSWPLDLDREGYSPPHACRSANPGAAASPTTALGGKFGNTEQ